jgi:hypothetical protein
VTRFAAGFDDGRAQAQVEHTVETVVAQRVFGIALGYEDLIAGALMPEPASAALPLSAPSCVRQRSRLPHCQWQRRRYSDRDPGLFEL